MSGNRKFNMTTAVEVQEVSTVDEAANLRKFALRKAAGGDTQENNNTQETTMADLKTPIAKQGDEDESEDKKKKAEDMEEVKKAKAELAAEREELAKARETLAKEVTDLKAELKKERDEKLEAQYITKAKTNFGNVPGIETAELGKVLKNLHMVSPDDAAKIEEVLAACEGAIVEGNTLDEAGVNADSSASGDAWTEIEKRAKAQLEANPGLGSLAKAVDKVLTDDPALYDRYNNE